MDFQQARDIDLGALVLVGNANFQAASYRTLAAAWLFGRHRTLIHLGCAARISFWRGKPYLLTFREAGP